MLAPFGAQTRFTRCIWRFHIGIQQLELELPRARSALCNSRTARLFFCTQKAREHEEPMFSEACLEFNKGCLQPRKVEDSELRATPSTPCRVLPRSRPLARSFVPRAVG